MEKIENTYKLKLSDNSFIIVDNLFSLCLFNKDNYKDSITLTIEEYFKGEYKDYILLDKINDELIPISFNIEKYPNLENLPLEIRFKKIQDIQQFEYVMGPDGSPRQVIDLHRGTDDMFEIETEEGKKHIVNGDHILILVNKDNDNDKIEISVKGYLNKDNNFKNQYKLIKVNYDK